LSQPSQWPPETVDVTTATPHSKVRLGKRAQSCHSSGITTNAVKTEDINRRIAELHDERLHDFYSTLRIIRLIKSRWIRWVEHMAYMGQTLNLHILVETAGEKEPISIPRQ
jgi:hypothetical protein